MSLPIRRFVRPLRLASLCLIVLLGLPAAAAADPHGWGRYRKHHHDHGHRAWHHDYDDDHDCDRPDEVVVYRRYYAPPARSAWRHARGGYGHPGRSGVDVDGTIVIRIGD